jgi:hypothetical protein
LTSRPALRTDKVRRKLVRLISLQPPGPSRFSQPTVRRPLTAHRQSRGRRQLI